MRKAKALFPPAVLLILCVPGCAPGKLAAVSLDGGYGHLGNMSLDSEGNLVLYSHEGPRRAASVREKRLSPEQVGELWRMAEDARAGGLKDAYTGGDQTFTLEFIFPDRTRKIRITSGASDDRPVALRDFIARLKGLKEPK